MKLLLATLLLASLSSRSAHADELDDHLKKLTAALEKNQICSIAVLSVPSDAETRKIAVMGSLKPYEVNCVGDLNIGKGTANEKSGCAFFVLNLRRLASRPFMDRLGYGYEFSKKPCNGGGFEELMERDFTVPGQIGEKISRWIVQPELPGLQDIVLLHTKKTTTQRLLGNESSFEQWFKQKKAELKKQGANVAKSEAAGDEPARPKPAKKKLKAAQKQKIKLKEEDVYESENYQQD